LGTILAPSQDQLELHLGEGQSAAAILALPHGTRRDPDRSEGCGKRQKIDFSATQRS
jgi:hypothetical protein